MLKQIGSLAILIGKTYLLIKTIIWVWGRVYHPELYKIDQIDWILVLLILDTWLVSHTKIEITKILKGSED